MTVHLLNAAVMPAATGIYTSSTITKEAFANEVKAAMNTKCLVSYIGYPETAKLLTELCGVEIPINRTETILKDRDIILIAKLIYRVKQPGQKGQVAPTLDDFEFRKVTYIERHVDFVTAPEENEDIEIEIPF